MLLKLASATFETQEMFLNQEFLNFLKRVSFFTQTKLTPPLLRANKTCACRDMTQAKNKNQALLSYSSFPGNQDKELKQGLYFSAGSKISIFVPNLM